MTKLIIKQTHHREGKRDRENPFYSFSLKVVFSSGMNCIFYFSLNRANDFEIEMSKKYLKKGKLYDPPQ